MGGIRRWAEKENERERERERERDRERERQREREREGERERVRERMRERVRERENVMGVDGKDAFKHFAKKSEHGKQRDIKQSMTGEEYRGYIAYRT